MSNALDLLLGGKVNIERPVKEVKLPRLSNEETEFILTVEAITMKDFKTAQEVNRKGKELDEIGMNLQLLTYGIQEFDGRRKENKEQIQQLLKAYSVADVQALLNKLLLPGEIAMLAAEIVSVSGFTEDMVEAVKKE
jgi:predicted Zn-dependent peptidase